MATLRDVAARAGVSVGAVSRILGNDPSLVIRDETRARVIAAAGELQYRPNRLAAGLRTRRARVLALFLPEPQNLGWAEMLAGVGEVAAAADHLLAIADVRGPAVDPDVFGRYAYESRVDGVLLATGLLTQGQVTALASRGLPLIALGSRYATLGPSVAMGASVTMRDEDGGAMAVEHLAGLGHRRIAFVAVHRETDIVARRGRGIADAMAARGLEPPTMVEPGAMATLLQRRARNRPTALITGNLTTALATLEILHGLDQGIPAQISLVTFDDHPVAAWMAPALTCIRMPMRALGRLGAGALLDAIDGLAPADTVVPDVPELVVRTSTGPLESGHGDR